MKRTVAGKEGKAYAFFKSHSPGKRIRQALENMKADPEARIPSGMQFSLHVMIRTEDNLWEADKNELAAAAQKMRKKGANYLLKSVLADATNRETADILGDIFNLIYSCTEILGPEKIPVADIYFKQENGVYVSKLDVE